MAKENLHDIEAQIQRALSGPNDPISQRLHLRGLVTRVHNELTGSGAVNAPKLDASWLAQIATSLANLLSGVEILAQNATRPPLTAGVLAPPM